MPYRLFVFLTLLTFVLTVYFSWWVIFTLKRRNKLTKAIFTQSIYWQDVLCYCAGIAVLTVILAALSASVLWLIEKDMTIDWVLFWLANILFSWFVVFMGFMTIDLGARQEVTENVRSELPEYANGVIFRHPYRRPKRRSKALPKVEKVEEE